MQQTADPRALAVITVIANTCDTPTLASHKISSELVRHYKKSLLQCAVVFAGLFRSYLCASRPGLAYLYIYSYIYNVYIYICMCIPWCVCVYIYIQLYMHRGWYKLPFSVLVRYSGFLVHIILVTSCLLATSNLSIHAASAVQNRVP